MKILHNNQLMIEYNDEHNEDASASASAQTSYHQIQFTEHSYSPMDTVDAQDDDEDDHIYNWLGLFRKFV